MAKPIPLKIGETDCPGCGTILDLKVNIKGSVYVYCNHLNSPGDRCFYKASFGRTKSKALIDQFMQTQPLTEKITPSPEPQIEEVPHVEPENIKPEVTIEPSAPRNIASQSEQPGRGSIFSRLLSNLD